VFLFILYKIGEALAFFLPSWLAYCIAEKIADVFFLFPVGKYKNYREAVLHNLALFVESKNRIKCAREVFRNFARYIREFLWLGKISERRFFKEVIPLGTENLDTALKIGKGVLLLSAHFGNWEWGGISLALAGYKMCFLVRPHVNPYTGELFNNLRRGKRIKVIPVTQLRKLMEALNNNEVIAVLIDEGEKGIKVKIFNKIINLAAGPFKMAYRYGAVISPAFIIRDRKTGKQKGIVEPPIILDFTLDMDRSIRQAAQKFADIMEDYLRFYPDHWLLLEKKQFYLRENV